MAYSIRFDQKQTDQTKQTNQQQATQTDEVETIYVTMFKKDPQRHVRWRDLVSWWMCSVSLALVLIFVLVPDSPVFIIKTIRVPAILLPLQMVKATVSIKATGSKTYPATNATGILTITNGSSLSEFLRSGFLVSGNGIEVMTDQGVTIPASDGQTFGRVTVPAQAVQAGKAGNIPAYTINQTYGVDIYIKNLRAFTGGQDVSSVRSVTDQDRQTALESARQQVEQKKPIALMAQPCREQSSQQETSVTVSLLCQPVTYHTPNGLRVVSVSVADDRVILAYRTLMYANT